MADIAPEIVMGIDKYLTVTWPNMQQGDIGLPVSFGEHAVKSVQIFGTVGAGGIPLLQGSMNDADYEIISYDGTNLIALVGMFNVYENPKFLRAAMASGDGTTDITVILGLSRLV